MAYMVKTGGRLLPSTIKELKVVFACVCSYYKCVHCVQEDIPAKRRMMLEILESTWLAATCADGKTDFSLCRHVYHTNTTPFVCSGDGPKFRAECIIANPPSYGHIHVAEVKCG